ncbi:hypothetical protein [Thiomonas sp. OC7]|nr:hypothetical protein [Thiomonas sp. OC7]
MSASSWRDRLLWVEGCRAVARPSPCRDVASVWSGPQATLL